MWYARLLYLLGAALLILCGFYIIPLSFAMTAGDENAYAAFLTALIWASLLGLGLFLGFRGSERPRGPQLTIALPLASLLLLSFFAGLPFYLAMPQAGLSAAFFEGMSFLTTSGASAYPLGILSVSFQLWQALLAWLGGFLAMAFALSFLPAINSGAVLLHQSPFIYGDKELSYQRLGLNILKLYPYYIILTFVFTLFYILVGANIFSAFSLAVSGLSLTALPFLEASLQNDFWLRSLMTLAMILGLLNPDMLQRAFRGRPKALRYDPELYSLSLCVFFSVFLLYFLIDGAGYHQLGKSLYISISALSTTGYSLIDPQNNLTFNGGDNQAAFYFLILFLCVAGGASMSATGGLKQIRLWAIAAHLRAELRRLAHPHSAHSLRVGKAPITDPDSQALWLFTAGYILCAAGGVLFLSIIGLEFNDSFAFGFASLTLSGPLAHSLAPTSIGYSSLNEASYITLSFLMLIGRIEISFLIAFFARSFWQR